MSKVGVYGVVDRKANAIVHLFNQVNDQVALRTFSESCADPGSMISRHPEDYELHRICWIEQTDGKVEAEKEMITTAAVVRALSKSEDEQNGSNVSVLSR